MHQGSITDYSLVCIQNQVCIQVMDRTMLLFWWLLFLFIVEMTCIVINTVVRPGG